MYLDISEFNSTLLKKEKKIIDKNKKIKQHVNNNLLLKNKYSSI